MTTETYHAIPILAIGTIADYEKHGEVTLAPDCYQNGNVTKEVSFEEMFS